MAKQAGAKSQGPIAFDVVGIRILLKRGFSVRELAEIFEISRPTVQKIIDKEDTPTVAHPGITLYVNARVKELIEKTTV